LDISYIVRELTYIDLPGIKFMLKAALVTLGLSGAAIGIGSCIGAVVGIMLYQCLQVSRHLFS